MKILCVPGSICCSVICLQLHFVLRLFVAQQSLCSVCQLHTFARPLYSTCDKPCGYGRHGPTIGSLNHIMFLHHDLFQLCCCWKTWWRRSRCPGAAGCSAVELVGYIVLDTPDCQYAAKAVRCATREPTKLDWMRMMRLAKFLVAHSELEWLYQAQDVLEKHVVCAEAQTGTARKREGAQRENSNSLDSIPSNSAARLSTSEKQSCLQQDVRQDSCSLFSCWSRLEWP